MPAGCDVQGFLGLEVQFAESGRFFGGIKSSGLPFLKSIIAMLITLYVIHVPCYYAEYFSFFLNYSSAGSFLSSNIGDLALGTQKAIMQMSLY